MKYQITRKDERGGASHGWLNANHYFSFGSYYDPNKMGFGKLRVINDDHIAPSSGFPEHPHSNMEIITIPLSGAVTHKDSQGNKGVIQKGEVQVMSAGTGIVHSEFNESDEEALKLFQIWIEPNKNNVKPRYDQKSFEGKFKENEWTDLVTSIDQEGGALKIHQEATIKTGKFKKAFPLTLDPLKENRGYYLLVVSGEIELGGQKLSSRDSIALVDANEPVKTSVHSNEAELLLLEVPLN